MIQGVAFDFDGVIVESEDLKTKAFSTLFQPFGKEIEEKVVAHHIEHGGISRYEKVRYYYEEFIKQPISQEEVDKICAGFSKMVVEEVIKIPLVAGVEDYFSKSTLPLFIISGTPEEELRYIVQQRKMEPLFQKVYGSPQKKDYWLRKILTDYQWEPKELLFIGDSMSDYRSAEEVGVPFIGRVSNPASNFEGLPAVDFIVSDLLKLPDCIQKLNQKS